MRQFNLPNQSVRWLLAELVVVVLGILIAFQVEEWRTERSDNAFAESSLRAILVELEDEYTDFQIVTPSLQSSLIGGLELFNILEGDGERNETKLVEAFRKIGLYSWYPNSPTYSGMRESGRIYLLSDSTLIEALFDYYEFGEYVGQRMSVVENFIREFRDVARQDVYSNPLEIQHEDPLGLDRIQMELKLVYPLEGIPRNPDFNSALGRVMNISNAVLVHVDDISSRNIALQELIKTRLDN